MVRVDVVGATSADTQAAAFAVHASSVLAAAALEYAEVTEETLALAERRVHGIKCRPRLLW